MNDVVNGCTTHLINRLNGSSTIKTSLTYLINILYKFDPFMIKLV